MDIKKIVKDAPKMLAEFYGVTEAEAKANIHLGPKLVRNEFEEHAKRMGTYAEFYEKVQNYPYDLAKFNSEYRLTYLRSVYEYAVIPELHKEDNSIHNLSFPINKKLTMLDIGGGGGELSLLVSDLFDVTYLDVPGTTFDYAKFRAEKYGANIRFVTEIPDEKFDVISAQDMLEHVEDLDGLLKTISNSLVEGGLFISSALWFNANHPLHIRHYAQFRDEFPVVMGNQFAMWLNCIFVSEGIQDKESESAIGVFRYLPDLTEGLYVPNLFLARVVGKTPLPVELPNVDEVVKTQFVFTVT
jgi:2-polyprenyl-3-methyl-5-hydroxy-6-metoxy-1,4-benzoquinol methylase